MKNLLMAALLASAPLPALAAQAALPVDDDIARKTAAISGPDAEKIVAAIEAGGELVVVDVLGVVCDFCALAMNKTFASRKQVAATAVDLDRKTLTVVIKKGAVLSDEEITSLVTRAGYKVSKIRRGEAALSSDSASAEPSDRG